MPVSRSHKLVVLGGERVGKTAIIEQFIFGNHVIGQGGLPTLGDVYEATVETEKGPYEKLHIFDTPGSLFTDKEKEYEQEHYLNIADGYLLVYEITSKSSYDLVLALRQRIASRNREAPIVILGNKCDLNAIREVDASKASHQCKIHGVKFYEVTVLDRDRLKEPMCYMAWRMANPGRPFPQLPSLSSSSRHSVTTTTTTSTSQATPTTKTHSNKRSPMMTSEMKSSLLMTSSASKKYNDDEECTGGEAVGNGGSEEEEEEGEEDSLGAGGWRPLPDDAQFPRGSGGNLFFADCLSSRNKYRDDVI